MDELKARILSEGKVLPGNIIKVGSFLNHKVDTALMGRMAEEFENHFDLSKITLILTIEASGIALASVCSYKWGIPLLFAKKAKSDNIENGIICCEIFSYTYK
ncbi:MAG: xanthine phosphoribosyltransferase, partial [Spirochaetales bacterium]